MLLGLNAALAVAFGMLVLARDRDRQSPSAAKDQILSAPGEPRVQTNRTVPGRMESPPFATGQVEKSFGSNEPVHAPVPFMEGREPVDWRHVDRPEYLTYLQALRAVGCPEDKVRQIALADLERRFLEERRKVAVELDWSWWKPGDASLTGAWRQAEMVAKIEVQRRNMLERLLGRISTGDGFARLLWHVPLTGEVLGGLTPDHHNPVQEICRRSLQRQQEYQWTRFRANEPINPVEQARMREQTRQELRQVLSPAAFEEFMLRYSHHSESLRAEFGEIRLSPDEFRRLFRGLDLMTQQMQLEFGTLAAMSARERDRYETQRGSIIRAVLGPERFETYLAQRDLPFRKARDLR
jgi:hypothetical protein